MKNLVKYKFLWHFEQLYLLQYTCHFDFIYFVALTQDCTCLLTYLLYVPTYVITLLFCNTYFTYLLAYIVTYLLTNYTCNISVTYCM